MFRSLSHQLTRLTIISLLITGMVVMIPKVQAASPSPSPSASPKSSPTPPPSPSPIASPTEETNEKVKEVIQNLVQNVIDKVTTVPHGYIGQVQHVTSETVSIQNDKGLQIISLTPDVSLVKAGKAITVDDVSVGDWAMVLGKQDDDGTFAPELITISSTSLQPTPHLINIGTISAVTKAGFDFQAIGQTDTQQITFAKTSQMEDNADNPLTYKQLPNQAQALVVAIKTTTGWALQELQLTSALPTVSPSPTTKVTK